MSKAWYALRRTIPPWRVDILLPELVEFCRHNHVDEVILKVDVEEFSHGIPTIEWMSSYRPSIQRIKDALENAGVVFSINPWVTLVHCDRGRDISDTYPEIDLMVGHDGTKCKVCSCPLSTGWRSVTSDIWSVYASFEPDVLWVEDDIRLLNHDPVQWGCFCDLHMAEFSKRVGQSVTRQELVSALLAPGEPHPWRSQWLDQNKDIMTGVGAFLEETVHNVSPHTKLGLMCSMPNHHSIEGRDWDAFTSALAGDQPLVARPCMCNYNESNLRGLYYSEMMVRQTMHCLRRDAIVQTELESWPFTTFSKSATFTFLQMALSFVLGADGVTMNLFDHVGSPIADTPEFGVVLREKKAYLNALAQKCKWTRHSGIQLLHNTWGAYYVRLNEGDDYLQLAPEEQNWATALEALGFAVSFEESAVVAISGQILRGMSRAEVEAILSKGVLLDLSAVLTLEHLGYGNLLGISVKRIFDKLSEPLAAEELTGPDFGGKADRYLTLTLPDFGNRLALGEFVPMDGTRVVSWMVDMDRVRRYPMLTLFENSLGGRVAVYPIDADITSSPAFLHPYRKQQLGAVIDWLGQSAAPLAVKSSGAYPLPFRNDGDGYSIIGSFNLSLDEWSEAIFELNVNQLPSKIEMLDENGEWQISDEITISLSENKLTINAGTAVRSAGLIVLCLKWTE